MPLNLSVFVSFCINWPDYRPKFLTHNDFFMPSVALVLVHVEHKQLKVVFLNPRHLCLGPETVQWTVEVFETSAKCGRLTGSRKWNSSSLNWSLKMTERQASDLLVLVFMLYPSLCFHLLEWNPHEWGVEPSHFLKFPIRGKDCTENV